MLSIIICSVVPERLSAVKNSIEQTIGIDYEIIAINNAEKKWPIAKVYNYGASQAKYPYLFFVHEDVKFHSKDWGQFICRKLADPDCGVIGFAGSKVRLPCYSGWGQINEYIVSYLYQGLRSGLTGFFIAGAFLEHSFEEVITLDGLGLLVRKEVWKQYPFDENLLTGFHCYDIDFTLQIASAHYKNYVCCSNNFLIEHFSEGNYDADWFTTTMRMHSKWNHLLPMVTEQVLLTKKMRSHYEEALSYDFLRRMMLTNCTYIDIKKAVKEYCRLPYSWRHFRRCISFMIKLWKIKGRNVFDEEK